MVATIFRIRDAITTLFSHSNKIPFQKQHHTGKSQLQVNKTPVHSCKIAKSSAHTPNASNNSLTTIANVNNYNPKSSPTSIVTQITCSKLILHPLHESSHKI